MSPVSQYIFPYSHLQLTLRGNSIELETFLVKFTLYLQFSACVCSVRLVFLFLSILRSKCAKHTEKVVNIMVMSMHRETLSYHVKYPFLLFFLTLPGERVRCICCDLVSSSAQLLLGKCNNRSNELIFVTHHQTHNITECFVGTRYL